MLLTTDRDTLILQLCIYYGVSPKFFQDLPEPTLQHAWRVTQLHEDWGPGN